MNPIIKGLSQIIKHHFQNLPLKYLLKGFEPKCWGKSVKLLKCLHMANSIIL